MEAALSEAGRQVRARHLQMAQVELPVAVYFSHKEVYFSHKGANHLTIV